MNSIRKRLRANRRNSAPRRGRKLCMEVLEPRLALTWAGVPPTAVTLPAAAVAVTLNAQNDASATATIAATEVDYYSFTATRSGSYSISATTPSSSVDTVLGVFSATGRRLAYNDDIVFGTNTDSRLSINLTAGTRYYIGITNYTSSSRGAYTWTVDGPTPTTTTTTPTTPTTTTTTTPSTTGGFEITLSMSGLTVSQQAIFQQATDRWEQVIVGDLPNATYRGQTVDDLLINASATSIDGVNGVLGQAGPDALRSGSSLPYHGIMQFDSADLASMERSGLLLSVVLHEMGHILGIGTIWENRGLLSGAGTSNPIFVGAQATAAYNQLFGTSARGVPVENTGGAGTADGHWRDTIFVNELMTGWAGPGTNLPLSVITVASLADLGYQVNLAAADSYSRSLASSTIASLSASTSTTGSRLYSGITSPFESFANSTAAINAAGVQTERARMVEDAADNRNADLIDTIMASDWRIRETGRLGNFPRPNETAAETNLDWEDLLFASDFETELLLLT